MGQRGLRHSVFGQLLKNLQGKSVTNYRLPSYRLRRHKRQKKSGYYISAQHGGNSCDHFEVGGWQIANAVGEDKTCEDSHRT